MDVFFFMNKKISTIVFPKKISNKFFQESIRPPDRILARMAPRLGARCTLLYI